MQPFSHSSDTFHEPQEGNPLQALGQSISFGRFMSEPLAWEKWSSFNNNRYLEEVEKYSTPGSVAQKKAYFEAHYKKIAAQKAAAALEEQNLARNNCVEPETYNGVVDGGLDKQVETSTPREGEVSISDEGFSVDACGSEINCETVEFDSNMVDVDPIMEIQVVEDSPVSPDKPPDQHEESENKLANEVEINTTMPSDKLPLRENSSDNQESAAMKMKPIVSSSRALLKTRASKIPSSPARLRTPVKPRKEINSNMECKKTAKDIVDKTRTPASLYMSITSIPSPAGETNKIGTPILHKTRDARVAVSLTKATKDGPIPLRTPARASGNGVRKLLPVTPCPDIIRTKVLSEQTTPSRKKDVKWQSLCADHSKSPSLFGGDKSSRCSVSSSFSLRSEERAAKRKEYYQKLEEDLKAKEAQKMQLQANSKEKAENELRKLRLNLGFKAKPMPDFYHEAQEPKTQIKKIPVTRPRSPKLGRKPSSSISQEASSLPPKRSLVKNDGSKQGLDKASRTPTRLVTRTPKKNAHENASPNIQS
ncbi:Translation initiation factor if-2 [Thalictrum thalictroides]|uniref:Translation initiation factor if-2 n=1 Tax=Thalictrum thalictroides TaxID=46969 RepID=A0A7J6WM24_THATH|nr:Translation initiation factor if-2 [Thalictrum thalictroides]